MTLADSCEHTGIHAVQIILNDIVQLQDERASLSKERDILGDVLDVRPDDAVAAGGLGRRCTPD